MLRIPVRTGNPYKSGWSRFQSSSSIRSTFIEYFVSNHGHKHVKSSSVVPLCDPTVPFVNAGMNQFKGVFLGHVKPPCPRAVNSQKCVRVGGKHNDLDVVGTDGTHHTFFEMLGNWSFGDYYKKEACQMAWDLLLGPYRLKPENLVVTYFAGDVILDLLEDRECRDIWKQIGVPSSRLHAADAKDNFWEMGASGPCGPCTEIHYVNPDGSLTEIWNIVFIQCNRDAKGEIHSLSKTHVDTGMGLERMAALLQGVPSNYDTDLFAPIIRTIEKNSKGVSPYGGKYDNDASLDCAYRRLADHARMISICLADNVFPAASLNLKQILRKSFKMSTDIFKNPDLVPILYSTVTETLGSTYPELITKEADAKLIIEHERESYFKLRSQINKKWKDLVKKYPEVEVMGDVELAGFAQGYTEFKTATSKLKTNIMPGEVVFKLYDTHGFQEDLIQRVAELNNMTIDKDGFEKLLTQHKSRHKIALKEQSSNKAELFNSAIEKLHKSKIKRTNDQPKYSYKIVDNEIKFEPLKTKLVAILNEDCEWIDVSDPSDKSIYYLVTEDTNFYCEEGGQAADTGTIRINDNVCLKVDSVFKIRDFVFHKGYFTIERNNVLVKNYVSRNRDVILNIDSDRRISIMRNHTGVHLLNAAIRKVLPNSVVCQIGSGVTDKGLHLNLAVYGEKLSKDVVKEAQDLIRKSISSNAPIDTRILDSIELCDEEGVLMVPGETYPETGLRLVTIQPPLLSKELCCGTHAWSAGAVQEFCVTSVKGAGSYTPTVYALTGPAARQARELFCRAEKLSQVNHLVEPGRRKEEVDSMRSELAAICGKYGAPAAEYQECLELLDELMKPTGPGTSEAALKCIAEAEVIEAVVSARGAGRQFVVHFLRCSYLMSGAGVRAALPPACDTPLMLLGCAGGLLIAGCTVPHEMVCDKFNAERWLKCILPVFQAKLLPVKDEQSPLTFAEMTPTKVSLINCEQLVQDAMRAAVQYAKMHARGTEHPNQHSKNRQQN